MSQQQTIKTILTGGNPRSLERTEEVVTLVLNNSTLLNELYTCLLENDPIIRMRASDALEKISRQHPEWLQPYIPQLLTEISLIDQPSVQWHLAQILGQVHLTPQQQATAREILKRNLTHKKDWLVINHSMETLAKLSQNDDHLRTELLTILKTLLSDPHKSIASRARKLIATLES